MDRVKRELNRNRLVVEYCFVMFGLVCYVRTYINQTYTRQLLVLH